MLQAPYIYMKMYEYAVSVLALTPYSGGLNHSQNCTPASEDGLRKPETCKAEENS
jgi:hypothetical protein